MTILWRAVVISDIAKQYKPFIIHITLIQNHFITIIIQ